MHSPERQIPTGQRGLHAQRRLDERRSETGLLSVVLRSLEKRVVGKEGRNNTGLGRLQWSPERPGFAEERGLVLL